MTSMRDTDLGYRPGEHPVHGTWLSVDVVALTDDSVQSKVVLIERENSPHRGELTLPGGLLEAWNGETVADAARRILAQKAGILTDAAVIDVMVVSDPERDERGHTVSIVVATRVAADAPGAVRVADVPDDMSFAHSAMLRGALDRIAARLLTDRETTYALLGRETTVTETVALVRACAGDGWGSDSAIRSRLDRCGLYTPMTSTVRRHDLGRPARVYRATMAR